MNIPNRIKSIILIGSALLFSCESDLKYNLKFDSFEPTMVLNGTFSADSTWKIYLSQSSKITHDESWLDVENADIRITDDSGISMELTEERAGVYTTSEKPIFGHHYTIEAIQSGAKKLVAYGIQPVAIEIESVIFEDSVSFYEGTLLSRVLIRITDPEPDANYFQVLVHQRDSLGQLVPIILMSDDPAFKNIPKTSVITSTQEFQDYLIGTDQLFNETEYTFNVKLVGVDHTRELVVEVRLLSEPLFKYAYTYSKQLDIQDNPFVEPITVYSNIHNGFGIFGGYSSARRSVVP